MPLTEMGKMWKGQSVSRAEVQEVRLDMVSVRCPESSRGRDLEAGGYDSGSLNRDQLQRQELGSCCHMACSFIWYFLKCHIHREACPPA